MVEPTDDTGPKGERIAKRLARAGLCSRREAERWIAAGRVAVDGRVLESPAVAVLPHHRIVVDGRPLPEREPTALWRYHKPAGLVTTNRDPQGRDTIFDRLPPELPRVMTVGRLDLTTEGLLLLTNDGDLARFLELPSTGWTRRYRVRVNGWPDEAALARLADGVAIDGMRYGAGPGPAGPPARRQCLAHHDHSRRQEPGDPEGLRASGADREPADPHRVWAVPIGQAGDKRR